MAKFRITPATSVVTSGAAQHAFSDDSPAADLLTVDADAYLIALGANSAAALLANTLAWKASINGSLVSQQSYGIHLAAGNASTSAVAIGRNGEVSGNAAIYAESSATINNAGTVADSMFGSPSFAIRFDGAGVRGTINNSGTIRSSDVAVSAFGGAGITIVNTGTIVGAIAPQGSYSIIRNAGVIEGILNFAATSNSLVNTKQITGNIVFLNSGANTVVNSGQIDGIVFFGIGNDTMTNTKTISSSVVMGDGNDVLNNKGTITGSIVLGDGNDVFRGGNSADTVNDGTGADRLSFGGGNDTYIGTTASNADEADILDGGKGIDTYDATLSATPVNINLDKVSHDLAAVGDPLAPTVAAFTVLGDGIAGANDTITNFENVKGGNVNDTIYGSAAANELEGNNGNDNLFGFGGNDTLRGGNGFDFLIGGLGADILDGGGVDGSPDWFFYLSVKDSGVAKNSRDTIVNFEDSQDLIDLSAIDARTGTAADDVFTYINVDSSVNPAAAFTRNAGELRSVWTATGITIEGDVNGDGKADFAIDIVDPTHSIVLTSSDFLL